MLLMSSSLCPSPLARGRRQAAPITLSNDRTPNTKHGKQKLKKLGDSPWFWDAPEIRVAPAQELVTESRPVGRSGEGQGRVGERKTAITDRDRKLPRAVLRMQSEHVGTR